MQHVIDRFLDTSKSTPNQTHLTKKLSLAQRNNGI